MIYFYFKIIECRINFAVETICIKVYLILGDGLVIFDMAICLCVRVDVWRRMRCANIKRRLLSTVSNCLPCAVTSQTKGLIRLGPRKSGKLTFTFLLLTIYIHIYNQLKFNLCVKIRIPLPRPSLSICTNLIKGVFRNIHVSIKSISSPCFFF